MKNILRNGRIEVLIPIYKDMAGNCTRVITSEGENIIEQNISSCIKNIVDYYNINMSYMRENYGNELGIKNKVPVVINEDLIYIQFTCRKIVAKNDRASGYINYRFIKSLEKTETGSNIITESGLVIQTFQSKQTLVKCINYAKLCHMIYLQKNYNEKKILLNFNRY